MGKGKSNFNKGRAENLQKYQNEGASPIPRKRVGEMIKQSIRKGGTSQPSIKQSCRHGRELRRRT